MIELKAQSEDSCEGWRENIEAAGNFDIPEFDVRTPNDIFRKDHIELLKRE